jgi:hypothetical protein
MSQLDESRLRFEFTPDWSVERYDGDEITGATGKSNAHSFYRNQVSRLPLTKAVDFVALFQLENGYLIEVKDFRGYRIQNKKRLTGHELALEVAHKVRDTVAGLVGAWRNESNNTTLTASGQLLFHKTKSLRVVLWLEDDVAVDPSTWREELNTLTTRIQGYLRWLTPRVIVLSGSTYSNKPPGINVSTISRPKSGSTP